MTHLSDGKGDGTGDIERLLREAFDAKARHDVGDAAAVPPPRFAHSTSGLGRANSTSGLGRADSTSGLGRGEPVPRRRHALAPLLAAAAVVAVIAGVIASVMFAASTSNGHQIARGSRTADRSALPATATPVHVKLLNSDGTRYGVGMPVIAYFSQKITDGRALQRATRVTVNDKPAQAAWYFEPSKAYPGYPVEGHLRMPGYWPAHSSIHVGLPILGASAGGRLAYDDSLTLDFTTGARNIFTVDDAKHKITLDTDNRTLGPYPVSLGARNTPTQSGVKVIMEKGGDLCVHGPGYNTCHVKYTQRLTYSGEYLHAAPWNVKNIERGVDSSNGCTNLTDADARKLYAVSEIGDVVRYPNATGSAMTIGQGYGDWNLEWPQWLTGGLVPTH